MNQSYQTGYKSLREISWNVTEKEYRADTAYSYSKISRYNREGFRKLNSIDDKIESAALRFGSIVDTIITDEDNFNNLYEIFDIPQLSDSLIRIAKSAYNLFSDQCPSIYDIPEEDMLELVRDEDYQRNWADGTRTRVVREKCAVYYESLFISPNKEIINQEDYNDAVDVVHELVTNPVTAPFFEPDNPYLKVEKLFQLKFKAEWNGIQLRCMFDKFGNFIYFTYLCCMIN